MGWILPTGLIVAYVLIIMESVLLYFLLRSIFYKKPPHQMYQTLNPIILVLGVGLFFLSIVSVTGQIDEFRLIGDEFTYETFALEFMVAALATFWTLMACAFNHLFYMIVKNIFKEKES